MLEVEKYLASGKTFADLKIELGIDITKHETLPLAILNYSQIDSPKTHPIVRECRGLVLNTEKMRMQCKSFNRFYNWGEVADEMSSFRWNKVITKEKVDGSLVLIYFFDGRWHVNTRGSFGFGSLFNEWSSKYYNMPLSYTWRDGILHALKVKSLEELSLDPALTYVGEFVSPWNKVVRSYTEPAVYMLSRFAGEEEIGSIETNGFLMPKLYQLGSAEAITDFLNDHPEATFEGVVVQDDILNRWKIKNARYLALHRLKGNGDALYNPKNLLPYILAGEGDELLTYYPEVTHVYREIQDKVNSAYAKLEEVWRNNWQIENQKEFALAIVGKTPFTSILFSMRKGEQNIDILKKAWRNAEDGILKVLFK